MSIGGTSVGKSKKSVKLQGFNGASKNSLILYSHFLNYIHLTFRRNFNINFFLLTDKNSWALMINDDSI